MTTTAFTLSDAITLATEAHAGVLDKGGRPYIDHPLRVMQMVAAVGYDLDTQIAAVLHDTVEDTTLTLADLLAEGVSPEAVDMVDGVTRRTGPAFPGGKEPYQGGLISRAVTNDGSRAIKLFDGGHNSLPRRTHYLTGKHGQMGNTRYTPARARMLAVEAKRRQIAGIPGRFPTDPDEFLAFVIDLDTRLDLAA